MNMKNLRISTKGQALVLVALMLVVLLAIAGLAVDVGMAYGVKAKLNAAVDAAAIAAGRVVSKGKTEAENQAEYFFNANYPSGLLGSTLVSLVPTAVQKTDKSWTITVTATAKVPTNFAKVAGFPEFTVEATATSTVRTLDLILVLDTSGSMADPSTALADLGSAAQRFIQKFDKTNDRVGLIHFAAGAIVDVPITETKGFHLDTVNDKIKNIVALGAKGSTTSEDALRMAKAQLDAISSQNSLRAIVMFTDGAPNGIAINAGPVQGALYSETDESWSRNYCGSTTLAKRMYFLDHQVDYLPDYCNISNNITTLPATDYTGNVNLQSYNNSRLNPSGALNTRCNVNIAARNMLENVAYAARTEATNPIYIFTIGLGKSLRDLEVTNCGYGSNQSGENILKRLANVPGVDTYNQMNPDQTSGLYAYAADPAELNNAFDQVANIILRLSK